MGNIYQSYIEVAKAILLKNWVGKHTKSSFYSYPHQWNWDSGFISVGYSRYMQKRAQLGFLYFLSLRGRMEWYLT